MNIFIECTIVDLSAGTTRGRFFKTFDNISDFNAWYKINKEDASMILNIMKYNPMEKPLLKSINDVKLLSVSREIVV
jgi:hypothetical protein